MFIAVGGEGAHWWALKGTMMMEARVMAMATTYELGEGCESDTE
jgi:hypothetical protein